MPPWNSGCGGCVDLKHGSVRILVFILFYPVRFGIYVTHPALFCSRLLLVWNLFYFLVLPALLITCPTLIVFTCVSFALVYLSHVMFIHI